jgi:hypothetical protein
LLRFPFYLSNHSIFFTPRGVAGAHSSGGVVSHDPNIAAPLTVQIPAGQGEPGGMIILRSRLTFSSRRVLSGILLTAHVRTSTDSSYLQSKLPSFFHGLVHGRVRRPSAQQIAIIVLAALVSNVIGAVRRRFGRTRFGGARAHDDFSSPRLVLTPA